MADFEVVEHEGQKMIRVRLQGETVRAEAGALHYYRGQIEMTSSTPSVGGAIGSLMSGETIFRPTYTGEGEVVFGPPIFGEYIVLELKGDAWILDQGAYVCSDAGVEVSAIRNRAGAALLSGEGWFQTKVEGHGKVVLMAPGRVEQVHLQGETLAVDGRFAVARSGGVEFSVKRASKSLVGSVTSGEGLLNMYSGRGVVLLAPMPNLYQAFADVVTPSIMPVQQSPFANFTKNPIQGVIGIILAVLAFSCAGCMGIFEALSGI